MTAFDEATAVRRRSDGVYDALPDQRFALVTPGGKAPPAVNGGALIATVLRAVLDSSPHPHPVATTAHFLRVARLEPAEVRVTWLKQGRTAATARAALIQDGQELLDMTVTTGTVPASTPPASAAPDGSGPDGTRPGGAAPGSASGADPVTADDLTWTGPPPDFPPIEDCVDLGRGPDRWPWTERRDTR